MPTRTSRSITNKSAGVQSQEIPYAATITPDPYASGARKIVRLTGNITIANPPVVNRQIGTPLSFLFIQDGTGGRTVTWGSDFQVTWTPTTTANKRNAVDFVWDGAKWAQVGQQVNI